MKQRLIDLLRKYPRLFQVMVFLHSTITTVTSGYIRKYMFARDGKSVLPETAWIDLTYRCNLRCEQCPQAHDLRHEDSRMLQYAEKLSELKLDEWKSVIDDLKTSGVKGIALSGGEIFLLGFAGDLIRHIRSNGLDLAIATNGTLLTPETAEDLVDLRVSTVSISLEGPEEIHNRICKNPRSFENALRGLEALRKSKESRQSTRPNLALGVTLTSSNYLHLEHLPQIAKQFRAEVRIGMLNYSLPGNGPSPSASDKGDDLDLPKHLRTMDFEKLRESWQRLTLRAKELDVLTYTIPMHMGIDEIIRWYSDPDYAYAAKCLAPWNFVYIDPYGRLLNCMLGNTMGDLRIASVAEVYNSAVYREFRNELRSCGLYKACSRCCMLSNRVWSLVPNLTSWAQKL
ncbi:MAG: radical SAM protein [Desulfomonile tiedjei]|nr:radical SAM protein [Desulfomonile tiedjei]